MLAPYPPQTANFSQHFDSNDRPKLLRGKKVLIIVGTTKAAIELRKAYVFIIHALGAEKVGTVPTAGDAKNLLATEAGQDWDWVYVHTNEELGIRALARFEKPEKKKFRKKADYNENNSKYENEVAELDKLTVKVIGDYFIVQSLILGAILDEGCDRAYNDPVIEEENDGEASDGAAVSDQEGEVEQGAEDDDEEDELS